MNMFNEVAKAKPLLKEVLLIGGPGDGCRMPVNLNSKTVNVIDDDGASHEYRKITYEDGGALIVFVHSSVGQKDIFKMLISGYRNAD
jgi:hypothetical protein